MTFYAPPAELSEQHAVASPSRHHSPDTLNHD